MDLFKIRMARCGVWTESLGFPYSNSAGRSQRSGNEKEWLCRLALTAKPWLIDNRSEYPGGALGAAASRSYLYP